MVSASPNFSGRRCNGSHDTVIGCAVRCVVSFSHGRDLLSCRMSAAGISGVSRKAGFGEGTPQQVSREGQKPQNCGFWHRGRNLLSVTANPGAYGGFSFSANITLEKGFAARCRRSFFLSAKDTFQRPSSTRWTGIFSNFLLLL